MTAKNIAKTTIDTQELKDLMTPAEGEQPLEVDLNDLYTTNGKYTPEQKMFAVICYMVEGNSMGAEKLSGIPSHTIRWWKNKSTWWDNAIRGARRKYQDVLDAKYTKTIHTGVDAVLDRLENGDEVVTKDGDVVHRQLSGKEIATIVGIFSDKRALLRGDPTSNPGGAKAGELEELKQNFEAFAKKVQDSGSLAKPIEHEKSADEILDYEEVSKDERKPK
jgi:hypothetical protein